MRREEPIATPTEMVGLGRFSSPVEYDPSRCPHGRLAASTGPGGNDMSEWIDNVARALATGLPRRRLLRLFGSGVVATVAASQLVGEAEAIKCSSGQRLCKLPKGSKP